MLIEGRMLPNESVTLLAAMVTTWALTTPLRFTNISRPLKATLETVAVPALMLAEPAVTGLLNLKTMVKTAAPLRHSTPEEPVSGRSISKVPALP